MTLVREIPYCRSRGEESVSTAVIGDMVPIAGVGEGIPTAGVGQRVPTAGMGELVLIVQSDEPKFLRPLPTVGEPIDGHTVTLSVIASNANSCSSSNQPVKFQL